MLLAVCGASAAAAEPGNAADWPSYFGNDAAWNRLLGRHMAKAGADRLWAEITAA